MDKADHVQIARPDQEIRSVLEGYSTFAERLIDVMENGNGFAEQWVTQDNRTRISYADMARDARRIASTLQRIDAQVGEPIVLAFDSGLDFVRALVGAIYAGVAITPVPLTGGDAGAVRDRIAAIAKDADARYMLCDAQGQRALHPGVDTTLLTVLLPDMATVEAEWEDNWRKPTVSADDLVVLQYTSGSTGTPKGVEITQSNLIANQRAMATISSVRPGETVAGWLPHYHDMGLIGLLLHTFAVGASLGIMTPSHFLRRPVQWLRMLSELDAVATVAPDFAFSLCARVVTPAHLEGIDLSQVRTVVTGAEPVRETSIDAFAKLLRSVGFNRDSFRPAYGMAETTLLISGAEPEGKYRRLIVDPLRLEQNELVESDRGTLVVSCGLPVDTEIRVVDPKTRFEVAEGGIGEFWVRGPSVSRGYRSKPSNREDPMGARLRADGPRYYRTGDLGAIVDGRVYITGRAKEVLVIRGRNIYPADIERTVAGCLGEAAAGPAAAFETTNGRIAVVLELSPVGMRGGVDAVRRIAHESAVRNLGTSAVDVHFVRRGALPRTTSGKIMRDRARSLIESGEAHVLGTVSAS